MATTVNLMSDKSGVCQENRETVVVYHLWYILKIFLLLFSNKPLTMCFSLLVGSSNCIQSVFQNIIDYQIFSYSKHTVESLGICKMTIMMDMRNGKTKENKYN